MALNQNVLQFPIDKKIENFDKGKFFIATEHEYIPKKVYYKKDPQIAENSLFVEDGFEQDPLEELGKAPIGKSMTYAQYIDLQQQAYRKPGANKPEIMAKVYAANKLQADSHAGLNDTADTGLITSLAIIAYPAAKPYSFGTNDPNAKARKDAIKTACDAFKASGTGKDWLGRTRKSNSDEFKEMLITVNAYNSVLDKGRVPTPLMTHMVVSKTLQYISDKYTVRDTKSGAERFDHAMEILRVTMPEDKYRQLLADINKARKALPGSKHYIGYDTYKPANWTDPKPKQAEAEQAQSKGPVPQPF